jgi:hypothetical protein
LKANRIFIAPMDHFSQNWFNGMLRYILLPYLPCFRKIPTIGLETQNSLILPVFRTRFPAHTLALERLALSAVLDARTFDPLANGHALPA